jgi:hypothetical protein
VVRWALAATALVAASALLDPEAWWARYAPQLWLVPVIVALLASLKGGSALVRVMGRVACAILLADALFVGAISFANVVHARMEIGAALDQAAGWKKPLLVRPGLYAESWTIVADRGLSYRIVSDETTLPGGIIVPYTTMVLAPAK